MEQEKKREKKTMPWLRIPRRRPRVFHVHRQRDRSRELVLANTAAIQERAAQMAQFEERLDNLEIRVQYLNSTRDPSFTSESVSRHSTARWSFTFSSPFALIRPLHEVIDLTNEDWRKKRNFDGKCHDANACLISRQMTLLQCCFCSDM